MSSGDPTCNGAAAAKLIEMGFRLVPLRPGTRQPVQTGWPDNPVLDGQGIDQFWGARPDLDIGILTGGDLVVLDVDPRNGGEESLRELEAQHGALPPTLTSKTGGGGKHFFFRVTAGVAVPSTAGALGPGLDVLARRKMVVAPPSKHHQTGRSYEWEDPAMPIAEIPAYLLQLATHAGTASSGVVSGQRILEGTRNSELYKQGAAMARNGLDADLIDVTLAQMNRERCDPPLGETEVSAIAASAARHAPSETPIVADKKDQKRVVDQAIEALSGSDLGIYQQGERLVEVVRNPGGTGLLSSKSRPTVRPIPKDRLTELLGAAADWSRPNSSHGYAVPSDPPQWVTTTLLARGSYPGVPFLHGVSDAPLMRPDGTVLQKPGYDNATEILYLPSSDFPRVEAEPTVSQVAAAKSILEEVVADFPFEQAAHRAAYFSAVLSMVGYFAFRGPVPMFLFDANTPGSGKSLLASSCGLIAFGEAPMVQHPKDSTEQEKQITSLGIGGARLVIYDNVTGRLGHAPLCQALTAPDRRWKGRVLGKSEMWAGPLGVVFCATGNNVQLGPDMARRVVHIRLRTQEENPEHRTGFRHEDLLSWVSVNRPALLTAALTILRAYDVAGRPQTSTSAWGSFEGWSRFIREAVIWVGWGDPEATRAELIANSDPQRPAQRQLVCNLHSMLKEKGKDASGMTSRDVLSTIWPPLQEDKHGELYQPPSDYPELAEAFEVLTGSNGKPTPHQAGVLLTKLRDRVFDGKSIVKGSEVHKTSLWLVIEVGHV